MSIPSGKFSSASDQEEVEAFAEAVASLVSIGLSPTAALLDATEHAFGFDPELAEELVAEASDEELRAAAARSKEADKGGPYQGSTAGFGGGFFGEKEPEKVKEKAKKVGGRVKRIAARRGKGPSRPGMKMVFGKWRRVSEGDAGQLSRVLDEALRERPKKKRQANEPEKCSPTGGSYSGQNFVPPNSFGGGDFGPCSGFGGGDFTAPPPPPEPRHRR